MLFILFVFFHDIQSISLTSPFNLQNSCHNFFDNLEMATLNINWIYDVIVKIGIKTNVYILFV